jgi:addiction module RelE/StbE family toxin
MYNIEITDSALQDLADIQKYLAVSLGNPSAASDFFEQVEKSYGWLEEKPFLYEVCRDPQLRLLGYRRTIIKRYIMFYKVDEESKTVYILRFVYGPSDYTKLI